MRNPRRTPGRILGAALFACFALGLGAQSRAATTWTEGRNYFLVTPPQQTSVAPGKVEVLEVFSYGCPACNVFNPVIHRLKASLPPNAQLAFMPAAFNPAEDWPMFQRAYYTAQALGIDERTHDAMYDAVWKTGELATTDLRTNQLKKNQPTIEDAARFYARVGGVKPEQFVAASKSFGVDVKIKRAEQLIVAYHVDRTPTIIVAGKYRLHAESAGGYDQVIELVKYLVAKESGGK